MTTASDSISLRQAIQRLRAWMESRQFAGYEPFDLLNAACLPGGWARLPGAGILLIQIGKRFGGLRLRQWLRVPVSRNPKALGLSLAACCDLARSGEDVLQLAVWLKAALIELRSPRETDFCWGYDWDYLSLRGSRLQAFSPNSIATSFCAQALLDMGQVFEDREAQTMGESAAHFVVSRLNRSYTSADAVCLSYTPHDLTRIYNSSALAGALLARIGGLNNNEPYLALARQAMTYLERAQLPTGGWYYGAMRRQRWVDSFHTSYNLCALLEYQRWSGDDTFERTMLLGHRYYAETFFTEDGAPRYFNNRIFPIDIHSCAQAILHFTAFAAFDPNAIDAAWRTFHWTMRNMASTDGCFYYQRHRLWTNRAEYMRWGQAWMLRALCALRAASVGKAAG